MGILDDSRTTNLITSDEEKLKYVVKEARNSLVSFYQYIIAPSDEGELLPPAPFHYTISDILLHQKGNFAIEAFRESAKTTYVIRAFILHKLMFQEKRRTYILIVKASQSEAARHLRQIQFAHQDNKLLRPTIKKIYQQSEEAYEVELYNGNFVRVEARGIGGSIRGALWHDVRPDIVIIDDPQDLETMYSETQLEKDWSWMYSEASYLGKRTRLFIIGNNLGEKCVVERLMDQGSLLGFSTMKIPAVDDEGNATWPAKYTAEEVKEEIDKARETGLLEHAMRELMCVAVPEESRIFRREDFQYFETKDRDRIAKNCNIYVTTDLAISTKDSADYSAIFVIGVDDQNNVFVLDGVFGRFDPYKTLDHIFQMVNRYKKLARNAITVGIEKVAFQQVITHILYKEMSRRGNFFVVQDLVADKAKDQRIRMLSPRFKTRRIYFPDEAEWLSELETQLLSFPRGRHDDLPDALAYLEQLVEAPDDDGFSRDNEEAIKKMGSFNVWG